MHTLLTPPRLTPTQPWPRVWGNIARPARDASHVWLLSPAVLAVFSESASWMLNDVEKLRLKESADARVGSLYGSTRAALRCLLANYVQQPPADLMIQYGSRGKPALNGSNGIEFSVSHSHGHAVVAITQDVSVGVDLERERSRSFDDLAAKILGAQAASQYENLDRRARGRAFAWAWSEREALVKALGLGIGDGWRHVIPLFSHLSLATVEHLGKHRQVGMHHLHYVNAWPGFSSVLCCTRALNNIELIRPGALDTPLLVERVYTLT